MSREPSIYSCLRCGKNPAWVVLPDRLCVTCRAVVEALPGGMDWWRARVLKSPRGEAQP